MFVVSFFFAAKRELIQQTLVYPTQKKSDTTNVSISHTEEIRYNKR